ncbi:MAG TPA: NAD(P)-dependent alcohol dehydrogenase [Agromyces sp.]|nr:NAD(P)-dependent alcohol dehydrogenase [Agromyces sp.]
MRAAVVERYGGPEVVQLRDIDEPTIAARDLLVRVETSTVGSTDGTNRTGRPAFSRLFFGLTRPRHRVLGYDFAGMVERVGPAVSRFAPGDRVYGTLAPSPGAHAEFVRIAEDGVIARIPDGLDAAGAVSLLDGFFTAIPFLRDGARVRPGQTVLVNGASGTVGSAAVQFATHLGASVTGVCSTEHVDLVRSLGAHRVIDYTHEDFAAVGRYDVIFDAVGKRAIRECRPALTRDGIYLSTVPTLPVLLRARHARSSDTGRRAGILFTGLRSNAAKSADLVLIGELAETGAIVPVIDRVVPFDEIVEAHRRVDTGHKAGNVVVAMTPAAHTTHESHEPTGAAS